MTRGFAALQQFAAAFAGKVDKEFRLASPGVYQFRI